MCLYIGDILLFNADVIHASSKNTSDANRYSLDFRYILIPSTRSNWGDTVSSKYIQEHTKGI